MYRVVPLNEGSSVSFCKETDSEHCRLCWPYGVVPTTQVYHGGKKQPPDEMEDGRGTLVAVFNKILFTKTGNRQWARFGL